MGHHPHAASRSPSCGGRHGRRGQPEGPRCRGYGRRSRHARVPVAGTGQRADARLAALGEARPSQNPLFCAPEACRACHQSPARNRRYVPECPGRPGGGGSPSVTETVWPGEGVPLDESSRSRGEESLPCFMKAPSASCGMGARLLSSSCERGQDRRSILCSSALMLRWGGVHLKRLGPAVVRHADEETCAVVPDGGATSRPARASSLASHFRPMTPACCVSNAIRGLRSKRWRGRPRAGTGVAMSLGCRSCRRSGRACGLLI